MNDRNKKQGFSTKAIHAGQQPDPSTGAIMTPIYASSTYVQQSPGVHQGYEYSRSHNPTRKALEDCIAALENGSTGYAFASGMSATATVLELLDSGDHVIAMDDLYGGTYRLFENVRKRSAGLEFTFANLSNLEVLETSLQDNTKMIWVESPTNPLLKLVNLKAVAEFAKKHNLIAVCDILSALLMYKNLLILDLILLSILQPSISMDIQMLLAELLSVGLTGKILWSKCFTCRMLLGPL